MAKLLNLIIQFIISLFLMYVKIHHQTLSHIDFLQYFILDVLYSHVFTFMLIYFE